MTAAMECGDSRRGGLGSGHGERWVATTALMAASAARAQGGSGCGREERLCGGRAHSGQWRMLPRPWSCRR